MEPINRFNRRQLWRDTGNIIDTYAQHKTAYKNVHDELFDIWPITVKDLKKYKMAKCPICQLEFVPVGARLKERAENGPNSRYDPFSPLAHVMTRLLCGHVAHTTCIFGMWDKPAEQTQ